MLILYHKYAATALVGFLFFHTIHYVTCLRAKFIIYTLSNRKDAQCHAQVVQVVPVRYWWQMPVRDEGKGYLCGSWRIYFISSLCFLTRSYMDFNDYIFSIKNAGGRDGRHQNNKLSSMK